MAWADNVRKAKAETAYIERTRPQTTQICENQQSIVFVKCNRGTFIGCETSNSLQQYDCKGGYPVPATVIVPVETPPVQPLKVGEPAPPMIVVPVIKPVPIIKRVPVVVVRRITAHPVMVHHKKKQENFWDYIFHGGK